MGAEIFPKMEFESPAKKGRESTNNRDKTY